MTQPKEISIACVGYDVKADWYEGSTNKVLLVLLGYTSSKDQYVQLVSFIVENTGTSALVLDYSGHGASPFNIKDLTPAQNFLEVITAFDWIKDKYPEKSVLVMGTSYGGFQATQLTKYREFDKLILRVPAIYKPSDFYTKWRDMEIHRHDYRINTKDLDNHPLLKRASDFKGKTFVITHELDDVCPPNSTMPFVRAFNADHWEAKGLIHSFKDSIKTEEQKQEYYNKIAEWLKK